MVECQTCIRYVIVLTILHILIGIDLTNKLQNRRNYFLGVFSENSINFSSKDSRLGGRNPRFSRPLYDVDFVIWREEELVIIKQFANEVRSPPSTSMGYCLS